MSFLHPHSCECAKSELDLFALPPTQTSIESGHWVHYKTVSSISENSPLEFVIPGGEDYIDLSQTLLSLCIKICKDDGSNYAADNNIAPINNILHSMFSQVDVYLNQKLISPPNNSYAYKCYLETLLNYDSGAKNSHLTCGLWYADTAGKMNIVGDENSGCANRFKLTSTSREVDLIGHLNCDIFNQEKFLINGVEMRLKFVRSRDSFALMSSDNLNGKIQITDATLLIRRNRINRSVLLAHAKALELSTAKYPITRTELKVLTIPQGVQGKSLDNVYLGQLPIRCAVCFVTNKAFNGDYTLNPFNFENFGLNYLSLYVDGNQVPSKPLQPVFVGTNKKFVSMYHTLFSGTGIHFLNTGNGISRDNYADGYSVAVFDLTPDLSSHNALSWNLIKNGSLRIEVGFNTALTETVNCLVYGEFDSVIEIDKKRNVIVDYSS
ncbi:Uncharacterized protein F54H12.2-like Protein [Tribolium castaneum]|uniref:Uncharacterized protein F54H12.2-like Protein n=1 Tax=Tribolium castaneum TaxID=7070 RepID=D7EJ93_TRICA|nr:Uncharacterized protein F54H12.2-like Protein [Tribolium castaneum]